MSFVKGVDLGKSKFIVVIASSIHKDDFFSCSLYFYTPTELVTKLNSSNKSFGITYVTLILDIELN